MTSEQKVLQSIEKQRRYGNLNNLHIPLADFKVIKSSLEKQIPKKPIPEIHKLDNKIVAYHCPNCDNKTLGNNEYQFDRCEDCGQALDWS